jgi:hypothetical protein
VTASELKAHSVRDSIRNKEVSDASSQSESEDDDEDFSPISQLTEAPTHIPPSTADLERKLTAMTFSDRVTSSTNGSTPLWTRSSQIGKLAEDHRKHPTCAKAVTKRVAKALEELSLTAVEPPDLDVIDSDRKIPSRPSDRFYINVGELPTCHTIAFLTWR